jgi:hypothetical protein
MKMNLDQILAAIRDNYDCPDIRFMCEQMATGNYDVRKQLADKICLLPAAVAPIVLLEISRWGITDEMSNCKEIQGLD